MNLRKTQAVMALVLAFAIANNDRAMAQTAKTTDASGIARAAELKKQGDKAHEAFRFAEALAAYSEAFVITGDPALLYNKGRALEGLNDFPQALVNLEAFELKASPELKARVPGLQALLNDVRARITKLTVQCNVEGAEIRLAERAIGVTPAPKVIAVNAGKALLEVTAEGYMPFSAMQTLPGGGDLSVDVKLVTKGTSGVLAVSSSIAGTSVSVDGKSLGQAPVEATLTAGDHRIRLGREGYEFSERTVLIAVGERKSISVSLTPTPGIASQWWFWTGIGVVVASGATVTYALLTPRSPDRGTIAPGQVTANLVHW